MELISSTSNELIGKLRQRYGIGKTVVYNRLKFLGIEVRKDNGNFHLLDKDLELLDELDEWIGAGNSTNTFPRPGVLVQSEKGGVAEGAYGREAGSIRTSHGAPCDGAPVSSPIGEGETEIPTAEEGDQIRVIVRSAQQKAAGILIAENILTEQFKNNPDMLDDDLRRQVRATEEALAPKSLDPKQYALSLVARYRSRSPA